MFKEKGALFYELVSCILLALGWVLMGQDYGGLHLNKGWVIACVIVSLLFIKLIDYYKKEVLLYLILGILGIGIFLILRNFSVYIKLVIRELPKWYATYDGSWKNYNKGYACILLVTLAFLMTLGSYLLHKEERLKGIGALGSFAFLIGCTFQKYNLPKMGVACLLCFFLIVVMEYCPRFGNKGRDVRRSQEGVMYLMPIALGVITISCLLPSSNNPIEWRLVKATIQSVKQSLLTVGEEISYLIEGKGEFSIGYTGEGKLAFLGGEIKKQDKIPLYVEMNSRTEGALYLTGSVSDSFTGEGWEKSKEKLPWKTQEHLLDLYELFYGLSEETPEDRKSLIKGKKVNIIYNTIKTKTVFYPLKVGSFIREKKGIKEEDSRGSILTNKALGKGNSYKLHFIELNLKSEELADQLRRLQGFTYETINAPIDAQELKSKLKGEVNQALLEVPLPQENLQEVFSKRALYIKEHYTALPESLSPSVRELSKEITKGLNNDYDRLKAIEEYFSQYTYTTAPPELPQNEDFLEYFLFTSKKGYCTYFATAMAVMGRCLDIPTRYVEGYVVDYKDRVATNCYNVNSQNAHAWVEAYIEGMGWIPLEPTPGYLEKRYTNWQKNDPLIERNVTSSGSYGPQLTQEEMMRRMNESATPDSFSFQSSRKNLLQIVGSLCLAFFILLLSYIIGMKIYQVKCYQAADNKTKLFFLIKEIFFLMGKQGKEMKAQETLLNYVMRRKKEEVEDNCLSVIVEAYMAMRYGYKGVSLETIQEAEGFKALCLKNIAKEKGKFKAFYYKLLFAWKYSSLRKEIRELRL